MTHPDTTDFGFETVSAKDKTRRVGEVFTSVASRYDLMNDLMSLGVHRLWKKFAVQLAGVREGQQVLDVAGGTGDLTRQFRQRVGDSGMVVLTDINSAMLHAGRDKLVDRGIVKGVEYVQANAEALPFQTNSFDCVSIAFGLRNVTDKPASLRSMFDVTRYGGCLIVLEFSEVVLPVLKQLYDAWSFRFIPRAGKLVANDEDSYRYLVESIRRHPDQENLKRMIGAAGFGKVEYHNLSGGIVAVHRAWKL